MSIVIGLTRSFFARLAALILLALALPGVSLAASYLPLTLTDVAPADKAVVANPAPTMLIFKFITKGKPNGAATKFLTKPVNEIVTASGVFSSLSAGPVASGAVLSITLENIPEENAAGKGALTGLTFGLNGTSVIDYYVCTIEYIPAAGAPMVTKVVKHQIITTIGITDAPKEAVKAKNINEAVLTMTRQIVSNGLNDLAKDPGFTGVAVAPAPEPAPEPAPAAPVETPPAAPPVTPAPAAKDASEGGQ